MHYYSHNIADYRKDTGHLSLLEHGIYRQLLDSYYLNEKPIETQRVIRRLQIITEKEQAALNAVLNDFFEPSECGEFWSHKRCDGEICKYQQKAGIARVNGSKGGRPKKPTKTQRVNLGSEKKPRGKLTINHKPITNNHIGGSVEPPAPKKIPHSKRMALKTYIANCDKQNTDPIPKDSIVFENAEKLGLPYDFVLVAWERFKDHWIENKPAATKTDWIATFNNCLKGDGYGAYHRGDEGFYMTTKGKNTKLLMEAA